MLTSTLNLTIYQQEIDIALSVLYDLAEDNVQSMAVYGVFIKGILDYLDNLTLPQIRTLFAVFSILALGVSIEYCDLLHIAHQPNNYRLKMDPNQQACGQIYILLFVSSYQTLVKNTKIWVSWDAWPVSRCSVTQCLSSKTKTGKDPVPNAANVWITKRRNMQRRLRDNLLL